MAKPMSDAERDRRNAVRRAKYAANPDKQRAEALAYYAANRDRCRAAMKARYETDHEQRLADGRAYYAANFSTPKQREERQEAIKTRRAAGNELERAKARDRYVADPKVRANKTATARQRYARNPGRWRQLERTRRAADIERARIRERKNALVRRARKKQAFVEVVDPLVVYERDDGTCQICGDPVGDSKWHIDHIIPLSRNGEHSYANTQLAHARCNLVKADKVPQETQGGRRGQ